MKLTTKSTYSIEAMYYLAKKYHENKPTSISNIAGKEKISKTFLEQIFNNLRKANLVKSIRGSRGGYILSKPPKEINIIQILSAVKEQIGPTFCVEENYKKRCKKYKNCIPKKIWENLRTYMENFLNSVTLEDLLKIKNEEKL